MARTCATCQQIEDASNPLKKCSRCSTTLYCSRGCQKADWPTHKRTCRTADTTEASEESESANDAAYAYWTNQAHLNSEARALAESLNLDFPDGRGGLKSGITYPLRRLAATGQDNDENLRLLFGSSRTLSGHDSVRLHVLLQAPPGSPASVMYRELDQGCPSFTPRPANDEEQAKLQKVRDMQEVVRRQLGERKEVTKDDMVAVLMSFGGAWDENLQVYNDAVNTMDQGVTA